MTKSCQCGRPPTVFKVSGGDVYGECSERASHMGHDSFHIAHHTLEAECIQSDAFGEVWVPVIDGTAWPERRGTEEGALHVGKTILLVGAKRGWLHD